MADNTQLPPPGGPAGFSAVAVQPGRSPGGALLVAVLLVVTGAVLGLLGGVIWAAAAPRVVYQVYSHNPPTAYATNPETNAFIAADGIYTFIALGGGALLGLGGYLFGVRRYGPGPMVGVAAGGLAAAYVAKWLGPVLTGQDSFNSQLGSSKPGALLRAPIALGAHGALAFWPVAAAFVAGGLELASVLRARQTSHHGPTGTGSHRAGRPGTGLDGQPFGQPPFGQQPFGQAQSRQSQRPGEPAIGPPQFLRPDPAGTPAAQEPPPDPDGSAR